MKRNCIELHTMCRQDRESRFDDLPEVQDAVISYSMPSGENDQTQELDDVGINIAMVLPTMYESQAAAIQWRQLQRLLVATAIVDLTGASNNVFGGSVSAVVKNEAFEVHRSVNALKDQSDERRRREQQKKNNVATSNNEEQGSKSSRNRKRPLEGSDAVPNSCGSATTVSNDSTTDVDSQSNNDQNIEFDRYERIEIINRANRMKRMSMLLRSITENQRLLLQELRDLQTVI